MVSDVEQRILEYTACHPLVLVSHVGSLLGIQDPEVAEHLDTLAAAGLLRYGPRLRHQRAGCQITALGLREIGSQLPAPRLDLRRYWEDLGIEWLWLAAHRGALGEAERIYSEREMRAADQKTTAGLQSSEPAWSPAVRPKAAESSFALQLDGDAPGAHCPGLVLVVPPGRAAVELQLTPAGPGPLKRILTAYGRKPSIAFVLYLIQDGAIGDAVQVAAARLGLARLVHVQRFRLDLGAP